MLFALALISLSACETASFNSACVCPPIKEYSREFQTILANEIEVAPANAVWPLILQDYAITRAALRKCL
jgi:hypothetical protein